jgi:hypothetical protein
MKVLRISVVLLKRCMIITEEFQVILGFFHKYWWDRGGDGVVRSKFSTFL